MFLTTAARTQATRREKAAWLIIEVVRFVITTVMWRFGAAPLHAAFAIAAAAWGLPVRPVAMLLVPSQLVAPEDDGALSMPHDDSTDQT